MLIKMSSSRCEFYCITQRATRCLQYLFYTLLPTPAVESLTQLTATTKFPPISTPTQDVNHHFLCCFVYTVTEFKYVCLIRSLFAEDIFGSQILCLCNVLQYIIPAWQNTVCLAICCLLCYNWTSTTALKGTFPVSAHMYCFHRMPAATLCHGRVWQPTCGENSDVIE